VRPREPFFFASSEASVELDRPAPPIVARVRAASPNNDDAVEIVTRRMHHEMIHQR